MLKVIFLLLAATAFAVAEPAEEWEPYRSTGLFTTGTKLWVVPDMEKETVGAFTSRLLEGARQGDASSMATLGRFFYAKADMERAVEWLRKAAEGGHGGAFLDLGSLHAQGRGVPLDLVEAYVWIWLATWEGVPGADGALREISQRLDMGQVLRGVHRAVEFQKAHPKKAVSAGR